MKDQLRNTANRRRAHLEDLEGSQTESVELTELTDEMLDRVIGGAVPVTSSCNDVNCD